MTRHYGELIGNTIVKVMDVDVETDNTGQGSFLRVRVDLNLFKPLACGRKITIMGDTLWISVKYEKLPKFCFGCSQILHSKGGCPKDESTANDQYGGQLRAETPCKNWFKIGGGENSNLGPKQSPTAPTTTDQAHSGREVWVNDATQNEVNNLSENVTTQDTMQTWAILGKDKAMAIGGTHLNTSQSTFECVTVKKPGLHNLGKNETLQKISSDTRGSLIGPVENMGQPSPMSQEKNLLKESGSPTKAPTQSLLAKISPGKFRTLYSWQGGGAVDSNARWKRKVQLSTSDHGLITEGGSTKHSTCDESPTAAVGWQISLKKACTEVSSFLSIDDSILEAETMQQPCLSP